MLEFVLDLVFDIILEGSSVLISKTKIPIFIRVIAFIIIIGLYLAVAGLLIYIGYSAMLDKDYIAMLLLFGGALFVLICGFFQIRKELSKRNLNNKQGY